MDINNKPKPTVTMGETKIPFTYYQLVNAAFCLKMFKAGMKVRHVTLGDIRRSLNLKSKNTTDCLVEVQAMIEDYKKEISPLLNTNEQ